MKKGFTLIELLAVILILGIIALIAIPTVNNIISEARYGAFKSGNENIMREVEQTCQTNLIKGENPILSYLFKDGKVNNKINIKGSLPNDGYILLDKNCVVTNFYLNDGKNEYSNGADIREDYMLKPTQNGVSNFNDLYPSYYSNIISISFLNNLNIPENAIEIKDPSVSGNEKIKSWLIPNEEFYDLYVGSEKTIYANYNSSYLFSNSFAININLDNFNTSFVENFQGIFANCLVEYLNVDNWDTSNVKNMSAMFYRCLNLKSLNLSRWNTLNVTNMSDMFAGKDEQGSYHSLEYVGDLNNWNTSKVTKMYGMFYACFSLKELKISKWDTSKVTTMNRMFYGCKSLIELDLSNFNTENVVDFSNMFCTAYKLAKLDISGFRTNNGQYFDSMFLGCFRLKELDLSNFNMSKATTFNFIFSECHDIEKLNLSNWNLNMIDNYTNVFQNNKNLKTIIMHNSNYQSINKIIDSLYDNGNLGELSITGVDDLLNVNTNIATNKNWNVI